MTPSASRIRTSVPKVMPPAMSQRRDTFGNRMASVYNNCASGLFLLAGQSEDVPVILRSRADEQEPIAALHGRLGVEDALAIGPVHRDAELDALVGAVAQHQRGRALRELDRLRFVLGQRGRARRQLLERVPRG